MTTKKFSINAETGQLFTNEIEDLYQSAYDRVLQVIGDRDIRPEYGSLATEFAVVGRAEVEDTIRESLVGDVRMTAVSFRVHGETLIADVTTTVRGMPNFVINVPIGVQSVFYGLWGTGSHVGPIQTITGVRTEYPIDIPMPVTRRDATAWFIRLPPGIGIESVYNLALVRHNATRLWIKTRDNSNTWVYRSGHEDVTTTFEVTLNNEQ